MAMKLLKCKVCGGEVDIVDGEHAITKKTKCRKCGITSGSETKCPEVIIIRKRPPQD